MNINICHHIYIITFLLSYFYYQILLSYTIITYIIIFFFIIIMKNFFQILFTYFNTILINKYHKKLSYILANIFCPYIF